MPLTHPRQRLADLILGRPVVEFIAERKANGDSFRKIANDLRDESAGEIDVSDVTIRSWHLAAATNSTDAA